MSANDSSPSNVQWLAGRLEEDIVARRLQPGEPYLTTAQAGRRLGISKATAYRAMKILVDRQVLVSHPGRGTFIGPKVGPAPVGRLQCIGILLTYDYFHTNGQSCYDYLAGLTAAMPGYGIRFDFLTSKDAETHVWQVLEGAGLSAVILAGCPQAVQEQVLNRGIPALVLGTDYSSTRRFPSVDADQFETGRLAADYLIKRGHRRIALLMREMWFPGDRRMFEGVGRALDAAGLGHDALLLRNLPAEPAFWDAEVRRLLALEDRPTGYICRGPVFAEAVMRAAEASGASVPDDIELIMDGRDRETAAGLCIPSVCMKVSVREQALIGGKMLAQWLTGGLPDPLHRVLPVELFLPAQCGDVPRKAVKRRVRSNDGATRAAR